MRRAIARGQYVARTEKTERGKRYLVLVNSLPPPAQHSWVTRLREMIERADAAAAAANETAAAEPPRPGTLAEMESKYGTDKWQQIMHEAIRRERAVKAAMQAKSRREKESIAASSGINLRTLYNWIKNYKKFGLEGLVDARVRRQGPGIEGTRRRSIDPEAKAWMLALYKDRAQPSLAWCYERTVEEAKKRGWKMCSRATAYRIMAEVPRGELSYAREGEQEFMRKYMIKCQRDTESLQPYQVVMVDHHECDFYINYGGQAVRPWLTVFMDIYSRCIVGWAFSVNPNSQVLALAFRHMVLPKPDLPFAGLPLIVYCDNGKDMQSKHFGGKSKRKRRLIAVDFSEEHKGILGALGVQVINAIEYWAWSKAQVERWFGTFADRFSRYIISWCGRNKNERPRELDKQLQVWLEEGKLPTLEDINAEFSRWLVEDYLNRQHSALKMTPLAKYQTKPHARPGRVDPDRLDLFLMKADQRVVTNQGIKFNGYTYYAPELLPLVADGRKKVVVRYDPNNMGEIHVFYRGQKLCVARCRQLLAIGATSHDLAEHRREQQRHLKLVREAAYGHKKRLAEVASENRAKGPRAVSGSTDQNPGPAKVAAMLPGPAGQKKPLRRRGELLKRYVENVFSQFQTDTT